MAKRDLGVPRGEGIRRELVDLFRELRKRTIAAFFGKKADWDLPDAAPPFELGAAKVSERFVPRLQAIWEDSGRALRSRVGLDPDRWQVMNPNLDASIRSAALDLAASTLASTTKAVNEALTRTREELAQGAALGDSGFELRKRIEGVFEGLGKSGARRIAQTEASRAHHTAQEISAKESGIVAGWEMLLSDDACPICKAILNKAKFVRLGSDFAVIGDHATYSHMRFPPFHPHCGCTALEVIDPAISGEPEPPWADGPYLPDSGEAAPAKPEPTSVSPPAAKPIGDRIKAWTEGDAILEKTKADLADADQTHENELKEVMLGVYAEYEEAKRSGGSTTEILKRWTAAQTDLDAEIKRRRAILDAADGPFWGLFGVAAGERGKFAGAIGGEGAKAGGKAAVAARDWLSRISRKIDIDTSITISSKPLRAEYKASEIRGGVKSGISTYLHEYGHAIEDRLPGAIANSQEFLRHRVGGEKPKPLKEAVPGSNYGKSEAGRKDRFDRAFGPRAAWYVGKDYGEAGTEVLSMGIEKLYEDPYGFAKNDPEFFKYVVGTLQGVFR